MPRFKFWFSRAQRHQIKEIKPTTLIESNFHDRIQMFLISRQFLLTPPLPPTISAIVLFEQLPDSCQRGAAEGGVVPELTHLALNPPFLTSLLCYHRHAFWSPTSQLPHPSCLDSFKKESNSTSHVTLPLNGMPSWLRSSQVTQRSTFPNPSCFQQIHLSEQFSKLEKNNPKSA